jgi:hypothetical protein
MIKKMAFLGSSVNKPYLFETSATGLALRVLTGIVGENTESNLVPGLSYYRESLLMEYFVLLVSLCQLWCSSLRVDIYAEKD